MEILRANTTPESLAGYAGLFSECFPGATKLASVEYLRWLYAENPEGSFVGFDAVADGRIAAHYACIPMRAEVGGEGRRVLLSLNTATHPDYQRRGLFSKLAEATYAAGSSEGFRHVYGVANANSTPGFIRKLGFTLVRPLDAKIGLGRVMDESASRLTQADFRVAWGAEALAWRMSNPANVVCGHRLKAVGTGFSAKTGRPGIVAWSELPIELAGDQHLLAPPLALRTWIGCVPPQLRTSSLYREIPASFRPSPLNLIFRSLAESDYSPDSPFVSFLDFDAF